MKKRWLSLYVENEIGVLARISGLFAGKSYNLASLTVGATENETISRMTISLLSDDKTFEQIQKQLNRSVEVIKVVDISDTYKHAREIMYLKVNHCNETDKAEIFHLAEVYKLRVVDYCGGDMILESVKKEDKNSFTITVFAGRFPGRVEVVRGGSVAMEGLRPAGAK